jgi:hypothetical protein
VTRAPAALALAAALSAPRTVGAGPCAPRADLSGDAAAIARVAAELQRLGDATGAASAGCTAVHARIRDDAGGGIAVAIVDGARTQDLVVGDAALAAAWIDSWLRDELTSGARGGSARLATSASTPGAAPTDAAHPAAPPRTAEATPPAAPPRADLVAAPPRPRTLLDRLSLAADYATLWLGSGTTASGIDVAACVRVGPACLGARAHYASTSLAGTLTNGTRSETAALATASVPLDLGRMSISPELAVGVGRMTTTRTDAACMPMNCDPTTDPTCTPTGMGTAGSPTCFDSDGNAYVGDKLNVTTTTPRFALALRIAVPLFEHVSLDAVASATLAPFGHGAVYGSGTMPDASGMEVMTSLPGEPSTIYQLAIGLRVGAP